MIDIIKNWGYCSSESVWDKNSINPVTIFNPKVTSSMLRADPFYWAILLSVFIALWSNVLIFHFLPKLLAFSQRLVFILS